MTKQFIGTATGALAVLLAVGVLVGCSGSHDAAPAATEVSPALTVEAIQPEQRGIPLTLAANGSIAAWQEAVIGAEVGGLRLAEVRAEIGDRVKKGQTLAVFTGEGVSADVAQAEASLAEAEATLADARQNASRARQVSDSGALSAQQVTQYLTSEQTALARVKLAQAQLDAQSLRLRYTRVRASDDGVVSARSATVGAVSAQGEELFRLIRQNRLEWRAEVTAAELSGLTPGQRVVVSVPGLPSVNGRLRAVSPTLDPQTRNAMVYVDLPKAAEQGLRPGMFGRGEIARGSRGGLTVPQEALSLREGFSYLFRIEAGEGDRAKVSQVKVELGQRAGDRVEVLSGIAAGDRIVSRGGAFLADGDTVKVVSK